MLRSRLASSQSRQDVRQRLVAIDANLAGDMFLIVSRGGNQCSAPNSMQGRQARHPEAAKDRVDCRVQTGNLPSGVAMRQDGTRGHANNEVNFSVTSMIVEDVLCLTLERDIPPAPPRPPVPSDHAQLLGKVAYSPPWHTG